MEITFDTKKLNWIKIPGEPELWSFMQQMRNKPFHKAEDRDKRYDLPKEFEDLHVAGLSAHDTLCKISEPVYSQDPALRRFGYCEIGRRERCIMLGYMMGNTGCVETDHSIRLLAICTDLKPLGRFVCSALADSPA